MGKDRRISNVVWELLSSVRFAIVIFSVISLTSIIGTVLEQGPERFKNIHILAKIFGESLAPAVYSILEKLGFMDMYRSWWFVTLLFLLSTNIVICSVNRLPRIWKMIRQPIQPLTEEHFEKVTIKRELLLRRKLEEVKDVVKAAMKDIGFRFIELKEDKGYQFYSQKGGFTRLGVYITHLSILLILIGALIGIFLGFKGFINIPEGKSYSVAFSGRGHFSHTEMHEIEKILSAIEACSGDIRNASIKLNMDEDTLRASMRRYGLQPLGFSIRCDDFNVDFYEGSDIPKEFKSWLTVIDDGREVMKKTIEVNAPFTYKGITLYQASYGMVPNPQGKFIIRITTQDGLSKIMRLNLGDTFDIPGTKMEGTILDFSPALAVDSQGTPFTYAETMNNPAVLIRFKEKGREKYTGWILKRNPYTWRLPEGPIVEFIDLWGAQYTGLKVKKDPGIWLIYLACVTISIGLYMAFFMSHRKIWISITQEKDNTKMVIGATSDKRRGAFEKKIDKMLSLISKKDG